jgi:hypothetical protein
MKRSGLVSVVILVLAATGCGGLCATYTALEIEQWLGSAVGEGYTAGPGGTACQWDASSDPSGYVQIQVIEDTSYWENPELAEGYETVAGVGQEAFVAPDLKGWKAGALTPKEVVFISMSGGSSEADTAVSLLRDAVDRL